MSQNFWDFADAVIWLDILDQSIINSSFEVIDVLEGQLSEALDSRASAIWLLPATETTDLIDVFSKSFDDPSHSQKPSEKWRFVQSAVQSAVITSIAIYLKINASQPDSFIVLGPHSHQHADIKTFKQFWVTTELRRFKSGEIRECVVFDKAQGTPVLQIIRHIINIKHSKRFSIAKIWGLDACSYLPDSGSMKNFTLIHHLFDMIIKLIKNLNGLPLKIIDVYPNDSSFRFSSLFSPLPSTEDRRSIELYPLVYTKTLEYVIKIESSSRWPQDLRAVQRIKLAFLIQIARLLRQHDGIETKVGIENVNNSFANIGYLDAKVHAVKFLDHYDIHPKIVNFRMRLFHERELGALETACKSSKKACILYRKISRSGDEKMRNINDATIKLLRVVSSSELVFKAVDEFLLHFKQRPSHTSAVKAQCHEFPALSGTIRILKRFIRAHLFSSNHICDEVIELLVCWVFLKAEKDEKRTKSAAGFSKKFVPGSVIRGFYMVVQEISEWNWQKMPLIIDFDRNHDNTQHEMQALRTFENIRSTDPSIKKNALQIYSSLDQSGIFWTRKNPSAVVANHFTDLMRVTNQNLQKFSAKFFIPDLHTYDFLLEIDEKFDERKWMREYFDRNDKEPTTTLIDSPSILEQDPVRYFFADIQRIYDKAFLFFLDEYGGRIIGGVIRPETQYPRNLRQDIPFSIAICESATSKVTGNHSAMLRDIMRLGDEMIKNVKVINASLL